jgi:hypothetical protein
MVFMPNTIRLTKSERMELTKQASSRSGRSVPDLKRKLMRYIRQYNNKPKPVKWKYFDPSRRISTDSVVTVH